jgi:hypothetical protein
LSLLFAYTAGLPRLLFLVDEQGQNQEFLTEKAFKGAQSLCPKVSFFSFAVHFLFPNYYYFQASEVQKSKRGSPRAPGRLN